MSFKMPTRFNMLGCKRTTGAKTLQSEPQNYLMAVGDDDQSIYGWRGARIENIQRFPEDFLAPKPFDLSKTTAQLSHLQAANEVIKHNSGRLGKELWTEGEKGDPITLYDL